MPEPAMSKSILATLAYYDVLDYPLTAWEVFKFLINPNRLQTPLPLRTLASPSRSARSPFAVDFVRSEELYFVQTVQSTTHSVSEAMGSVSFVELLTFLDVLVNNKELEELNGFYFMPGRSSLCEERIERNKIAEEKWKKARRYLFWVQFVPYIEAVFASGSLALGHTNEESDLDVLVVTKRGRIWLARMLISLVMSFLGVRRKGKEKTAPNKICLNYYITTDSLKIPFESLYNAQSYAHLIPVYWGDENIIKKFWEENGEWTGKFLCRWELPDLYQKRAVRSNKLLLGIGRVLEKILDRTKLADWLEKLSRKIQLARINTALPGRITANDRQLEFHPYSAEKDIIKKYNRTISELGIFENYQETDSGLR